MPRVRERGNNEYKNANDGPARHRNDHAGILRVARNWPNWDSFEGKLTVLEENSYEMDKETGAAVTTLGTTLWTDIWQPRG